MAKYCGEDVGNKYLCELLVGHGGPHRAPSIEALGPKHEHRFTVAVEWEVDRNVVADPDAAPFDRHRVTKLRCEYCPEEITRG